MPRPLMRPPRPRPFILLLLLCLLLLASCAPAQPVSDTDALQALVAQGARYVTQKDSRGLTLMSSAACGSPSYLFDMGRLEKLWATYAVRVDIESVRVVEIGADKAKVEVTQTLKKVSGPDFQDTRARHIYSFVKENGAWKLCANDVASSQRLP
ncbi:MAG: hypothetical protein Q7T26_10685 [Dehalococcoidia bacterium]|nr:hypothetical protein [Dehalococcoidia bacterium]